MRNKKKSKLSKILLSNICNDKQPVYTDTQLKVYNLPRPLLLPPSQMLNWIQTIKEENGREYRW